MPELIEPPMRVEDLLPASASMRDGGRFGFRHGMMVVTLLVNRMLTALPPLRWYYRRLLKRQLAWTDHDVALPTIGPGLDGLRIAFVTDLHAGSFLGAKEINYIFDRVLEREPDVICLGGDLVNSRHGELRHFSQALDRLDAPLGVFAVRGNHDLFDAVDSVEWLGFLERHGVEVLINGGQRLTRGGDSFWLCGVDDLEEGQPDLESTLEDRRDGEATVLLSHHPDLFVLAEKCAVDVTLSGHTHGGQIKIRGKAWVTHSHQGFAEGWYRRQAVAKRGPGGALYVSRGVGASVLPLRVDCPPELALFTLRSDPCLRS